MPATGLVRLAVTLGDPRGIGPEVAGKAAREISRSDPDIELVILGPAGAKHLAEPASPSPGAGDQRSAGMASVNALRTAVALASSGDVDGIVTGPVHKPALHDAGWEFPGQTELLQHLTGADEVGMLMSAEGTRLGPPLRVLLATTHIPLAEVHAQLNAELLVSQARLLHRELRKGWALESPRIALCALNPHASDDGLFGNEEAEIYRPAVALLNREGMGVTGPVPADTVFTRALDGEFDAVVAPYHDVGMAAFKTVSFGRGVNVTLGLPFVRTSPDHGTAFDLVGRDQADPSSMIEAVRLAARIVRNAA